MRRAAGWVLAWALAPACAWCAEIPDWLAAASRRTAPPAAGRAAAVVLHDEQIVEVPARGRTVVTSRWALRVVTREAAGVVRATAGYLRGSSEVRAFKAWTLSAEGRVVRRWDRRDAADVSNLQAAQLYTDLRHLEVEDREIEPGETFAWESVTEEEPLFAQWRWWFRNRYPCVRSRFELRLPRGLDAHASGAHLESALEDHGPGRWSWELRDQPAEPNEPLAPPRPDSGPYLRVQAVPDGGERSAAGLAFRDWAAVARWVDGLAATQSVVTPGIGALAGTLAGSSPDTLARVEALARHVQDLNYVAIALNIGRGWGYRPNEAGAVLRAGYGDCKDKANLLCTLLRAAGQEAWLLLVHSDGRDRIDTTWASPAQFDHCVVAVRAPASFRGPRLEDRRHGPLLVFDPTDPLTAFGDLPEGEQGSWGLLVTPAAGGLVRLPVLPPERNRLERRIDATLGPTGGLSAVVVERSEGQRAREERALRRRKGRGDYRSMLEEWLPAQGGSVEIRSWSSAEDTTTGRYELRIEYESPAFARNVGGQVLTFRSALVSPRQSWIPGDSARTMPIALPATCVIETLTVRLPEGFALDERPADVHTASDLGRLDATWSAREDGLVMTRRWELRPVTVGPERWRDVRDLYFARRASNEAAVVLVRR